MWCFKTYGNVMLTRVVSLVMPNKRTVRRASVVFKIDCVGLSTSNIGFDCQSHVRRGVG